MKSFVSRQIGFVLNKVAPSWSANRIEEQLLIPKSADRQVHVPRQIRQFDLRTRDGNVRAYRVGKGPAVVFVHGWDGGAHQFFPLMRGLEQCGFTALAFDHLGHGQSETRKATLQQFIATTNFVLHHAENKIDDGLYGVVGHSTGCIAVANARPALIRDKQLFLISPIFNYKLFFLKKLVRLNLHPDQLKQYTDRFTREYKREFSRMELWKKLDKYGDVTCIAHDQSDAVSPISDSRKFCQRYPLTKLMVTREYDHVRIINSESVWQELKSHLNYEDTTINFADKFLVNQE